jgi:hypothetical protein
MMCFSFAVFAWPPHAASLTRTGKRTQQAQPGHRILFREESTERRGENSLLTRKRRLLHVAVK